MVGTTPWARIQRPAPTCQLVSPSTNTRGEKLATARSTTTAIAATAKSRLTRQRAARARRGLKAWASLDAELKAIVAHACAAEASFALAEMERLNRDVGSFNRALQQAPKIFDPVGMHRPLDIANHVIDDFVVILATEAAILWVPSIPQKAGVWAAILVVYGAFRFTSDYPKHRQAAAVTQNQG